MIFHLIILIIGLTFLLWSANQLVMGASGIANFYKLPTLFIGLTVVAIGTTSPEIMVSVMAALGDKNDMAIGNVIGSNIANISLVLGFTALLHPLTVQSQLLKREFPILFVIMLFAYALMIDGYLSRMDGLLLLSGSLMLMIYFAYVAQGAKSNDPFVLELQEALSTKRSFLANVISLVLGLIILPISSHYLVNSAAAIAHWAGVSELIIGLTVISIGTSLPELATSIVAALKKEDDIAIGNILGSNMFNILLVMAFPGLISPDVLNHSIMWRDVPFMIIITLLLLLLNYKAKGKVTRLHGFILLMMYGLYLVALISNAMEI